MSDPQLPPAPGDGIPPRPSDAGAEFVPVDPAPPTGPKPAYDAPARPPHPRSHSGVKVVAAVAVGLVLVAIVGVLLVVRGVTHMAHVAESAHKQDELVDYKEIEPSQMPPAASAPAAAPAADEDAVWDEQPELSNPATVQRALAAAYPPLLRDAGIAGEADVRFRVREDGTVDIGSMDVQSATHDDFARAALSVVPRMRFRPGRRGGKPAAGWVTLPVRWQPSP